MLKNEPYLIYSENKSVWEGEPFLVFHAKEAMSNLLGVHPDTTSRMESILGTMILSTILIVGVSVVYTELRFIILQIQSGIFEGMFTRIIIWIALIIGIFLLLSLFKRYINGLRVNVFTHLQKERLLELSRTGERIVGVVEKIEDYSTIVYYYIQSGEKFYQKYHSAQVLVEKLKPMSKVAILKYGNQHILL